MAWYNVADGAIPNNLDIVEVQQANGSIQIACFIGGTWRIPTVEASQQAQGMPEIRNVIKWRPFTDAATAYQAKKGSHSLHHNRWPH